ncbi:MAG: hypothetical protein ACXVCY_03730 [Pseudobdellovibrionaceae bacterium]
MKKIFLSLSLSFLILSFKASAADLKSFHEVNFNPLGQYCGLHVEVSGKYLFVTHIIPPEKSDTAVCGGGGKNDFLACNGSSQKLICDKSICKTVDPENDGELVLELLENGNIFSMPNKVLSIRTDVEDFSYCR